MHTHHLETCQRFILHPCRYQHPEGHEARPMEQVTFRRDTVLSDVHLLLPNTRHLMTRLNSVGQPGKKWSQVSRKACRVEPGGFRKQQQQITSSPSHVSQEQESDAAPGMDSPRPRGNFLRSSSVRVCPVEIPGLGRKAWCVSWSAAA